MNRYHADGGLASSFTTPRADFELGDLGTIAHDVAGSLDGRVALAGELFGQRFTSGWVAVFDP